MTLLAGVFVMLGTSTAGPTAPVIVEGKRKTFLVDTGSSRTVLPQRVSGEATRMATAGDTIIATRAAGVRIQFAGKSLQEAMFLPTLKSMLPRRVDGVLGNDLLLQSPVTIDGPNARLELDAEPLEGETLPLTMRRGLPLVQMILKVPGKVPLPVEILIDTGSDRDLLLTSRCLNDLEIRPSGSLEHVTTASGRIPSRPLGDVVLVGGKSEWKASARSLETSYPEFDGIAGWSFLRQRVVRLDPIRGEAVVK